ncbi:MAG: cysteine peptidase family C39 domain-containing protein [Candidatus Bipolaricaulota bacterium]
MAHITHAALQQPKASSPPSSRGVRPDAGGTRILVRRAALLGSAFLASALLFSVACAQEEMEAFVPRMPRARMGPSRVLIEADGVASHRELRHEPVVVQTTAASCGPAAVATLLSAFFELATDEREAFQTVKEIVSKRGGSLDDPVTALDLALALEAYGMPARGYRVTVESIQDYFSRGGLTVIAHVTRPQNHFLLAVGTIGNHIILADPSWGRRLEPLAAFEGQRGFSGVVLVPVPEGPLRAKARSQQTAVLREASGRLARLRRLREALP